MSQPEASEMCGIKESPTTIDPAQLYPQAQVSAQQTAAPISPPFATAPSAITQPDTIMSDRTPDRPASPAVGATNANSPVPPRTETPGRNTNGNDVTSRATSQHPDPAPTMPKEAPPHGAPTRQYLNGKVTGVLLDGMKQIAKEQPRDPLRVLGEYLLQRSRELEGT
ncbi:hypothetical protein BJ875DRAFT_456880 [Amylocarpus encephaloides]|uniref:Dpy-30 domain-containing protein n=1 Tax=Amylocarpus encephaloides TaxID=45428 RepID=A0A9P8C721_9HELO|nr:hypothetical protein BJ875DRAFT_456880 [Amylocarpus encephaloides]